MAKHRYIDTIEKYYEGCNAKSSETMISTFTDDVVHYFVDHSSVSTAKGLANYWCKAAAHTAAKWSVDHALVKEPEVVIEWSMLWEPASEKNPELLRGTEWFVFRDEKIAEIRSYHCNFFLSNRKNRQLHDFDYVGRAYTSEA
jgi:hypothetical protein